MLLKLNKRNMAVFILLIAFSFLTSAQLADKAKHIEMAELIKKEYNAKNYKNLFWMMDSTMQKRTTEQKSIDFYKTSIYDRFGDIENMAFAEFKSQFYVFTATFKSVQLDLIFACSPVGKIKMIGWIPHKDKEPEHVPLKNENYLSNNAKKTNWDLKVDSIVKDYMSNGANCGLSIGIINGDEILYYNYGEVKRSSKQIADTNTIYEIGSISKTFTGILLGQAISDKKVNLTDDIRKYLPDDCKNLVYKGNPIKLMHLANHTSRIPRMPDDFESQPGYDVNNPYKNYNKKMVFNYLKRLVIDTLPGVKNEYSNLGMALLGIILEKVYNKTYEELVSEFITKPCGMRSTKIVTGESENKHFATGYNGNGEPTPHWDLGDLAPAGGIRSTSADMIRYIKANMQEASEKFKLAHSPTFNDGRGTIALAWMVDINKKGNTQIWHNGGTAGFSSFCGYINGKKLGVIVLSNAGNRADYIGIGILKLLQ